MVVLAPAVKVKSLVFWSVAVPSKTAFTYIFTVAAFFVATTLYQLPTAKPLLEWSLAWLSLVKYDT